MLAKNYFFNLFLFLFENAFYDAEILFVLVAQNSRKSIDTHSLVVVVYTDEISLAWVENYL